MRRCSWVNLENPLYIDYHDKEWGVPCKDDHKLFEMLILESFQAGLSWECILNKREAFREAYDHFDIDKVISYDDTKIEALMRNPGIVRNRRKITASIRNAKIYKEIQEEFGSFSDYLWGFVDHKVVYEEHFTTTPLSDKISKDLKKRGMSFVGSTIIYAYLEAVGVVNTHDIDCDLHREE
ncbi:MAG: DNA-3-methyladenine glycosylase I [Erysipelotrichaceae bacterium]|nr:DNA-3-methyladenine glycosylase I [Erysipelotrichaceae bacterium]